MQINIFCMYCIFFFKQKTAYEMRISDWSSDVCSSDLPEVYRSRDDDRRLPRVRETGASGGWQETSDLTRIGMKKDAPHSVGRPFTNASLKLADRKSVV